MGASHWEQDRTNDTDSDIVTPQQCFYSREEMVDHLFGDALCLYVASPHGRMHGFNHETVIMAPTNTETHWLNAEILAALE